MALLDMRTIMFSYVITSVICTVVMALLWQQNRRRSSGLGFWLADYLLQSLGLLLSGVLRGILPAFVTMILANLLILSGTVLLLIGLEKYYGKTRSQWHNVLYLAVFFILQLVFVYAYPRLEARNINISFGLLFICSQSAWLLLHRVDPATRKDTQHIGTVFIIFSLVSMARIFVDLSIPPVYDFFKSGFYDSLIILTYQILFIWLTFALLLMVDRRLRTALERELIEKKLAEAALTTSEEKFSKAFQNIPDAVVITFLSDGKIIEANASFFRMTGYSKEESLGRTTIEMGIWANLTHRQDMVTALQNQNRISNFETTFRKKSGELFSGSVSGELIQLQGKTCLLIVIQDITERKKNEEAIQKSAASLQGVLQSTADEILAVGDNGKVLYANDRFMEMWRIPQAVMDSRDNSILLDHVLDQLTDPQSFSKGVQELYVSASESFDTLYFKDGRVFERLSRPMLQGLEIEGEVWSFRDITARKQNEKLQDAIYRISMAADYAKNLDSLYPSIHAIIQEVMVADNFYIALYDEKTDLLSFPYSVDELDPAFPPKKPGKGMTEYILRSGKTVLCDEPLYWDLINSGEIELVGAHSPIWLGVPLIVEGKTIGVMVVQDYENPCAYGEREQRILEFVSTQVAQAIERKRLEEEIRSLSLTDELTGLHNRRGFSLLAEQRLKLAHREKRTMLLFFGDVDNLKRINDTLGHAQGDLALIDGSILMKETFREADILARMGGDEFVALVLDGSMESAKLIITRFQVGLEELNRQGTRPYQLSISMGAACYDPEAPCSISELVVQADRMMYEQKQARKGNQSVGFPT